MAFCASGVIMSFAALPSGNASLSSARRPRPVKISAAAEDCSRNRRRVCIAGTPKRTRGWSLPAAPAAALFRDGRVILLEQLAVARHEALAGVLVHFQA